MELEAYIRLVVGAIALLIFGYLFARGVAFAWFRTKMEYFRAMLKEMKKGD